VEGMNGTGTPPWSPEGDGSIGSRDEPDPAFADVVPGLLEREGRLLLPPTGGGEAIPVTVRWLRPLTDRSGIVFLDAKGREVLTARSLDAIAPGVRPAVERELRERYVLPTIERVRRIQVRFGTRYWEVDTDRGPRWFALKEPGKNVTWLSERRLVLRDTAGNRYEITDLDALDPASRRAVRSTL